MRSVLGVEIDQSLPFAYGGAFGALLLMQWVLRKPIARTYLENQRMNNRVTAQAYTDVGQYLQRQSLRSPALAGWLQGPAARSDERAESALSPHAKV